MTAGHLQDLSYFDQNKLNAVKGPNHWKITATPRGADSKRGRLALKSTTRKQKEPRKRRKMKLELDESDPEDKMTLAAIRKHYKIATDPQKLLMPASQLVSDRHQLDYVLDYDKNLLIRLGIRPEVTISRLQSAPPRTEAGDDLSEPYDYDNANDSFSFTGQLPVRAQSEQGMAFEDIVPPENNQLNLSVDDDHHNNNKQFFGKPVDYAKRQKKIDAKALKRSMRKILQPSRNGVGNKDKDKDTSSVESRNRQFSALCQALPGSVDRITAADLSVPIIFVVFLHLCNENGLELEQTWTMDHQNVMQDFIIHQPTSTT